MFVMVMLAILPVLLLAAGGNKSWKYSPSPLGRGPLHQNISTLDLITPCKVHQGCKGRLCAGRCLMLGSGCKCSFLCVHVYMIWLIVSTLPCTIDMMLCSILCPVDANACLLEPSLHRPYELERTHPKSQIRSQRLKLRLD